MHVSIYRKLLDRRGIILSPAKADLLKRTEKECKAVISKHWKKEITFTDVWADNMDRQAIDNNELLPGELSAIIFVVGCYTVRSAQKVYKVPEYYEGIPASAYEMPADQEELNYAKKFGLGPMSPYHPYNEKLQKTHEIMARHNADPTGFFMNEFQYVCRANYPKGNRVSIHSEGITFMCTVKESGAPNDYASLFVRKHWIGDSFGGEDWYQLNRHGTVTEFRVHPFDHE